VRRAQIEWSFGKAMHGQCPGNIEQEAGPEGDHVPRLQVAGDPLGPNSNGIKDQGQGYQGRGQD
jgi:hypothetical protein